MDSYPESAAVVLGTAFPYERNEKFISDVGALNRRSVAGEGRPSSANSSARRKLTIGEPDDARSCEQSVAIEHVVDLATCVALSTPKRSQYRERGRSLNGRGEFPGAGCVQGNRDDVGSPDGGDELGDSHYFDQVDGDPKDPLKLGDAGGPAMPQRKRAHTHDDCHRGSFWARSHPFGADRAGGTIGGCPTRRRVDQDATPR